MSPTHIQSIRQAASGKGVDVVCMQDSNQLVFRNVSENIVRCAIRRDYDYFAGRNLGRDGRDSSRPLNEGEITDFKTRKA